MIFALLIIQLLKRRIILVTNFINIIQTVTDTYPKTINTESKTFLIIFVAKS